MGQQTPLNPKPDFSSFTTKRIAEDELPKQPELGRCTVTWSLSLGAAVAWCGQGFWMCRMPGRQSYSSSMSPQRHGAPEKSPHKATEKLGTATRQKQLMEQPR